MKFFVLFFCFLFTINTWAENVPNYTGFVTDKANIFSQEEEAFLTEQIRDIEKSTTAEIAILSVNTTNGVPIFDYAMRAAETWGVGKNSTDNGLFILIAAKDRKYQVLTGYGLEGILPDARIDQISRKNFTPNFRKELYYKGVSDTVFDMKGFLVQDPSIIAKYNHANLSSSNNTDKISLIIFMGIVTIFILNIFSIFNDKKQPERTAIISVIFGIFVGIIFMSFLIGIISAFFMFILGNLRGTGGVSSSSNGSDGFGNTNFGGGSFGGFGGGSSSFGGGSFGGGGSSGSW